MENKPIIERKKQEHDAQGEHKARAEELLGESAKPSKW